MKNKIKIGIIGGSGLDDPDILSNQTEKYIPNEFGEPSDVIVEGVIQNVPCALLARHGRTHSLMPTNVNYRANIWALKAAGCTHVLATTACGSLKEELCPGDIVVLDSFIDRTQKRNLTFFDNSVFSGVCHLPMEPAFCEETRKVIIQCAEKLNLKHHKSGTCVTIEGPRFSTKAESKLYRSWGCDVVNMTTVPEVILAKEAGLCYAAIALVTDYDCWREVGSHVNVEEVLALFRKNVKKVVDLVISTVVEINKKNWDQEIDSLKYFDFLHFDGVEIFIKGAGNTSATGSSYPWQSLKKGSCGFWIIFRHVLVMNCKLGCQAKFEISFSVGKLPSRGYSTD